MASIEYRFPDRIAYRSAFGSGFNTGVVEADSGRRHRISRWSGGRRVYDVGTGLQDLDDLYTVHEIYQVVQGMETSFRFKDWLDFSTAANGRDAPSYLDQVIGTADGSQTVFQATKAYSLTLLGGAGTLTRTRTLNRLVPGTAKLGVDGVEQTSGWTSNDSTGEITFTSAPSSGAVTLGCEHDVLVMFGEAIDRKFQVNIEAFKEGRSPTIELVEDIEPVLTADEMYTGGASEQSFAADFQISPLMGRAIGIETTAPSVRAFLPDPSLFTLGGPHFYLHNTGSLSWVLRSDLITVASFPANQKRLIYNLPRAGVPEWVAI